MDNVALLLFVLHLAMTTNLKKPSTRAVKKTPKAKDKSLVEEAIKEQMSVGVRELRQDASQILDLVKAGQVIQITEHGLAIAKLVPINKSKVLSRVVKLLYLAGSISG